MTVHAQNAERFLADGDRARWHDESCWLIRLRRDRAAAGVPEWEELRRTAAAIKAHTLARLPDLLEQLEDNARANGITVHWARDGAEHNRVVHEILAARGVRHVVKSKSMLTEECGLNPYLEARGIEVVDTDLGERIVQLAGEPPSHIVMPAAHLRRGEIGALFHDRLGTPEGTTDPTTLTRAARVHLRAAFMRADAALSGVNFAIAETGGFVVVTNEGNADMGTGLPPLHVACMGLEKVIPRLCDLGVFLRLLARSASGQLASVYASHFHGPVRGGALHLVIVDNGRSAQLGSDAFRRSLSCIRCGACLNTCPVFRRGGGHAYGAVIPGPIGAVLGPLREPATGAALPFASTLCGSCSDVCPVAVDLHGELLALRRLPVVRRQIPAARRLAMKLAAFVLARPRLYELAGRVMRLLLRHAPALLRLGPGAVWARGRQLPAPPPASFREQLRRQP